MVARVQIWSDRSLWTDFVPCEQSPITRFTIVRSSRNLHIHPWSNILGQTQLPRENYEGSTSITSGPWKRKGPGSERLNTEANIIFNAMIFGISNWIFIQLEQSIYASELLKSLSLAAASQYGSSSPPLSQAWDWRRRGRSDTYFEIT